MNNRDEYGLATTLTWRRENNFELARRRQNPNPSRASCESKVTAGFLKVNENVELGQHGGFLSHGPAFRPTVVGQP